MASADDTEAFKVDLYQADPITDPVRLAKKDPPARARPRGP
jgi:hypothetical protein